MWVSYGVRLRRINRKDVPTANILSSDEKTNVFIVSLEEYKHLQLHGNENFVFKIY